MRHGLEARAEVLGTWKAGQWKGKHAESICRRYSLKPLQLPRTSRRSGCQLSTWDPFIKNHQRFGNGYPLTPPTNVEGERNMLLSLTRMSQAATLDLGNKLLFACQAATTIEEHSRLKSTLAD